MNFWPAIKKTASVVLLSSALACNAQLHSYSQRIEWMKNQSPSSSSYNPAAYVDESIMIIKDIRFGHEYEKELSDRVVEDAARFLRSPLAQYHAQDFDESDREYLRAHLAWLCETGHLEYRETFFIIDASAKLEDRKAVPLITTCVKKYALHGASSMIEESFYRGVLQNIGGHEALEELAGFAMDAKYIDDLERRLRAVHIAANNTGTYEAKKFAFDVIFNAYRNVPAYRNYYNERRVKSLADDIGFRWDMEHESPVEPFLDIIPRRR